MPTTFNQLPYELQAIVFKHLLPSKGKVLRVRLHFDTGPKGRTFYLTSNSRPHPLLSVNHVARDVVKKYQSAIITQPHSPRIIRFNSVLDTIFLVQCDDKPEQTQGSQDQNDDNNETIIESFYPSIFNGTYNLDPNLVSAFRSIQNLALTEEFWRAPIVPNDESIHFLAHFRSLKTLTFIQLNYDPQGDYIYTLEEQLGRAYATDFQQLCVEYHLPTERELALGDWNIILGYNLNNEVDLTSFWKRWIDEWLENGGEWLAERFERVSIKGLKWEVSRRRNMTRDLSQWYALGLLTAEMSICTSDDE